jgi:hypothetical protein
LICRGVQGGPAFQKRPLVFCFEWVFDENAMCKLGGFDQERDQKKRAVWRVFTIPRQIVEPLIGIARPYRANFKSGQNLQSIYSTILSLRPKHPSLPAGQLLDIPSTSDGESGFSLEPQVSTHNADALL